MFNKRHLTRVILAVLGVALITALFLVGRNTREQPGPQAHRERTRAQLELRNDIFCEIDTGSPFNGTLVEPYPDKNPKLAIGFRAGKPHGLSKGYYENGQMEVEEHFIAGISHGQRTRWYQSGQKKSEANIIGGKIEGTFTRWHPNGQKAAEVQMAGGKPHGLSEAWHESGAKKSRVELDDGKVVSQQFWEDGDA